MSDEKKSKQETADEILKNTYDEIVATSGLPKAYLAGKAFGMAVQELVKVMGVMPTIEVLSSMISHLCKVNFILQNKKKD